jgi:hypothetical protein
VVAVERREVGALFALFSLFSLFFAANLQPCHNGRLLLSTEAAVTRFGNGPHGFDLPAIAVVIIKSAYGFTHV